MKIIPAGEIGVGSEVKVSDDGGDENEKKWGKEGVKIQVNF